MNVVYELIGVDKASDAIKKVEGSFSSLKGTWATLTGLFAAGGTVAYLTSLVRQSMDAADQLNKLSQATGVAVEDLSGLKLAAQLSGLDMQTLATSINKLNKNMVEAQQGNDKLAALFKELGVNINGGTKEALYAIADAFQKMPIGAQTSAAAMEIFGKAGAAMIPFLRQGSEGIKELEAMAAKLGLTLTTEAAQGAEQVNDTLEIMSMGSKGFANQLMISLLPTLQGLAKIFYDGAGQGGYLATVIEILTNVFKGFVITVVGAIGYAQAFGQAVMALVNGLKAAYDNGGLISSNGRAAFAEAFSKGFEEATKKAQETSQTISNIAMNEMPKMAQSTIDAAKALGDYNKKAEDQKKAAEAAAKAAEKFKQEHDKLRDSANAYIQQQNLEIAGGEKLTGTQKELLKIGEFLRDNYGKLTEAQRDELREKIRQIDENGRLIDSNQRLAKSVEEFEKATLKAVETQDKETKKLQDQAAALQMEIDKLGLTKAQQEAVEGQRYRNQKAALEETAALMTLAGEGYGAEFDALRRRIAALDLVIDRQDELATKNQMVTAADEAKKAWEDTASNIEKALTDSLVRGFEGGKGVLASVGSYIVNFFKTQVASSIAKALTGALLGGVSGLANAAGFGNLTAGMPAGGGNIVGTIGNIASGASGIGTLGNLFGVGTMAGNFMGGFGGTLAGVFGESGIGGTIGAGTTALGAGNIAGGLGSLAPYALAAYGLYRLISGVGTGRQRSPAMQNYSLMSTDMKPILDGHFSVAPNIQSKNAYDDTMRGLISNVAATTSLFGGSVNRNLQYGMYTSVSPDGKGGQTVGQVFGTNYVRNENGSNESVDERMKSYIPQMFLAGLQASELPARIGEYFRSVDAASVTQSAVDKMLATAGAAHTMATAVSNLGGPFVQLYDLSVEARSGILALTGGLDSFLGKVQTYVQAFYSTQEQQALSASAVAAQLRGVGIDITGLDTREEFRALVDSLDLSTQTGQNQLAALLNVAGAFASLSDYLIENNTTLDRLAALAPAVAALTTSSEEAAVEQQATLSDVSTGISSVVSGVANVVDAVNASSSSIAASVSAAIQSLVERPVNVTVVVQSSEVNGGVPA